MAIEPEYPHIVECYVPKQHTPSPELVARKLVSSKEEAEKVREDISKEYPNGLCVQRPLH